MYGARAMRSHIHPSIYPPGLPNYLGPQPSGVQVRSNSKLEAVASIMSMAVLLEEK